MENNGDHAEIQEVRESPNAGLTIDLQNFRKPGEKSYTQRSRLFIGNLPTGCTEQEVEKLFAKYGTPSEIFINKDRGFGFIRLETKTIADIAKAELDETMFRGRPLRVRFATHGAALQVTNLPQFVSNELLEEAFSLFGQVERAIVIVDDRGRPTGKGIVEFAGKPGARKALDRCADGAFLLTAFPRPVTVEPMAQEDEDEGLPEKLMNHNQQFHAERENPPRFAQPGSFEYEYAMRWKALLVMEKQQHEQVDRNIKEAQEKLESEMDAARHEHQVVLMRQDLLRRQDELRRMEEVHSLEMQKRKAIELQKEEERQRREEEMRMHNEEIRRRQESFNKGNFPGDVLKREQEMKRQQEMRMQMAGGGPGMNRGSMGGGGGAGGGGGGGGNAAPAGAANQPAENASLMGPGPGSNNNMPGGGMPRTPGGNMPGQGGGGIPRSSPQGNMMPGQGGQQGFPRGPPGPQQGFPRGSPGLGDFGGIKRQRF